MNQPAPPGGPGVPQQANIQLGGGAAIVAPAAAFSAGVPQNALVVVPLVEPTQELRDSLEKGPVVVTPEQMWKLLGFNGPAVQVQDSEGRPIAIGLEDLLAGLEKNWQENKDDPNHGRVYAQELLKYGRAEKAAKVLARVVAVGGSGEDWLGLGVAQRQAGQLDKAESTLKGAQNLLPDNPFPSLHLARVYAERQDAEAERRMIERAISLDANCVDAWAQLFMAVRDKDGEEQAVAVVTTLADAEPNKKSAAPFVAIQGVYAGNQETVDKAFTWAQKAVERSPKDPLALVCLSALYGQRGDLRGIIELLRPHESLMVRDVRLANNYFEALFQAREIEKVTKLLNSLAASPQRDVKQFAIERSRLVAQFLQQQQAQLAAGQAGDPSPRRA